MRVYHAALIIKILSGKIASLLVLQHYHNQTKISKKL